MDTEYYGCIWIFRECDRIYYTMDCSCGDLRLLCSETRFRHPVFVDLLREEKDTYEIANVLLTSRTAKEYFGRSWFRTATRIAETSTADERCVSDSLKNRMFIARFEQG